MKRLRRASIILLTILGAVALLLVASHRRAFRVEREVLKPCLSPAKSYDRIERIRVLDSWSLMLPHWTITYREISTDVDDDTASITVDLFGRVVDWRSKDVALMLVEKGYRDDY